MGRHPAAAIAACRVPGPPLACPGAPADQQRCKLAGKVHVADGVASQRFVLSALPKLAPSQGGASLFQLGRRYDCRIMVRTALMLAISSCVAGFTSGW